jgi:enoyl-CoA hydratase
MGFEMINYEVKDAVASLILSRPARTNALNARMLEELELAMNLAEADERVRVVIVTGAGGAFSSGFDLKEQMERRPAGFEEWQAILRKDFNAVMRFWHCPKPTIAAVRGPCLAGAFELALACDMTIASETAFFGEPELKFGAGIVAMWLPWLVGPKVAKEIIFLGEDRLLVERARDLGIVNRIVSDETLEAEVGRVARHLSAIDPNLLKLTKRAINQTLERQGLLDALETALAIDVEIEGPGSPDKLAFMEVARAQRAEGSADLARHPFSRSIAPMSGDENLGRKTADALQALGSQTGTPGGQMLSAAEMIAASNGVAASLRARACVADEPVVLFIANEPLDFAGFLGIWLAGCGADPCRHARDRGTGARHSAREPVRNPGRIAVDGGSCAPTVEAAPH